MDTKAENQFGAMSVDLDSEPLNMEDVDSWLQRVSGRPTAATPAPKPATPFQNNALSPPATPAPGFNMNGGLNITLGPEPTTNGMMIPAQWVAKIDRLTKKVNELESTMYYLKEEISELHDKKTQLNQEIAGLTNTKSAIKTINQRLNTIQYGFSRILDRVEVLEKTASLDDVVRSTNNTNRDGVQAPIEFTCGGDGVPLSDNSINIPGNPVNVLSAGANRRGRNKHKRRAVDQGDRSTVAAPAFNGVGVVNPAAVAVGGQNSPEEIAKMEELLAMVVKKLAAMKVVNPATGETQTDGTTTSTGPTTSSSLSAIDGDVSMGNEAQGQVQAAPEQMVEDL